MNILVTGGAGFIGSNLIEKLLTNEHNVVCVDNYLLGNEENIAPYKNNARFTAYRQDAADIEGLSDIARRHNIEYIFHLAANSDIQASAKSPDVDYMNTFSTTYGVLECMRQCGIKKLFFASTSAIYGEKIGIEIAEDEGGLAPVSYYGGAKLASEAFISSYAYMNDYDVTIFRFPNVIGPRLTHGVIFDFIKKLRANPNILEILGDGTQCKPYIYSEDLLQAILLVAFQNETGVNTYNVGVETATSVTAIADMVSKSMGLHNVKYAYTGGNRGWKGDVPSFQYDLTKIHSLGWTPKYTSAEAVQKTLDSLLMQGKIT